MNKILILLILLTSCNISTPKEGQKIGRIVKLADEGLFYKTCEGELIRGGLIDGSGSMGTSFHFVIENERLKNMAYDALYGQYEVIITYRSELFSSLTRSQCSEPHFVIDIIRND